MTIEGSFTTTYTKAPPTEITITLFSMAAQPLLDNLSQILFDFRDCHDYLSLRLFEWGASVISTAEDLELEVDTVQEVAQEKLLELQQLLRDPITKSPLVNPVLDPIWVWEKNSLDQYRELSDISPYTKKPIEERTHDFALAMIEWLSRACELPYVFTERQIVPAAKVLANKVSKEFALLFFTQMAAKQIKEYVKYLLLLEVEYQKKKFAELNRVMGNTIASEKELTEKRIEKQELVISGRMEHLKETFKVKVDHLTTQAETLEANLCVVKKENREAKKKINDLEVYSRNLQASYNHLEQRLRQAEQDSGGGGCLIL